MATGNGKSESGPPCSSHKLQWAHLSSHAVIKPTSLVARARSHCNCNWVLCDHQISYRGPTQPPGMGGSLHIAQWGTRNIDFFYCLGKDHVRGSKQLVTAYFSRYRLLPTCPRMVWPHCLFYSLNTPSLPPPRGLCTRCPCCLECFALRALSRLPSHQRDLMWISNQTLPPSPAPSHSP